MLIALDTKQTIKWSLPEDTEPKTVFDLGLFDTGTRAYVYQLALNEAGVLVGMVEMVRFGVRGWDNLVDERGTPVVPKFESRNIAGLGSRQALTDESLNAIAPWINALGMALFELNQMAGATKKN